MLKCFSSGIVFVCAEAVVILQVGKPLQGTPLCGCRKGQTLTERSEVMNLIAGGTAQRSMDNLKKTPTVVSGFSVINTAGTTLATINVSSQRGRLSRVETHQQASD